MVKSGLHAAIEGIFTSKFTVNRLKSAYIIAFSASKINNVRISSIFRIYWIIRSSSPSSTRQIHIHSTFRLSQLPLLGRRITCLFCTCSGMRNCEVKCIYLHLKSYLFMRLTSSRQSIHSRISSHMSLSHPPCLLRLSTLSGTREALGPQSKP